jgi:hypothetical protein
MVAARGNWRQRRVEMILAAFGGREDWSRYLSSGHMFHVKHGTPQSLPRGMIGIRA